MNAIKQESEVKDAVVTIGQIHLLTNCMLMWLKDNCPWAEREQQQLIIFKKAVTCKSRCYLTNDLQVVSIIKLFTWQYEFLALIEMFQGSSTWPIQFNLT